jgi:hypothetical protein
VTCGQSGANRGQSAAVVKFQRSFYCSSSCCRRTVRGVTEDSPRTDLQTARHQSSDSPVLHREGFSCPFLWGFVSSVSRRCSGVPNTLRGISCYQLARVLLASCVSLLLGLWIEPRTKVFERIWGSHSSPSGRHFRSFSITRLIFFLVQVNPRTRSFITATLSFTP